MGTYWPRNAGYAAPDALLDIFITSPVEKRGAVPNLMGAALSIGTLALIPVFGRENLARRPRITE